jgi:glycosyltransferase involved in cell wall biosynthesis
MKNKLSLCLIVKASDEEAVMLEKALQETTKHVDELVVTITGQNKKVEEVAKSYGAKVSHFDWCNDFAKARQFNFDQATGDWILWMDADDTFEGMENLNPLIEAADKQKVKGLFFKYNYAFDKNGNLTEWHWKLQCVKNDGSFQWKGRIHEDLMSDAGTRLSKEKDVVRVHGTTDERADESFVRNFEILKEDLLEQGEDPDPRTLFYMGRTLIALREYDKAIPVFEEYLERSGWDEERYEAWLLLGEIYQKLDKPRDAIRAYNNSLLERDEYPDAYFAKAFVYLKEEEFSKAINNFLIGLRMPEPENNLMHNPFNYTKYPMQGLASAYLNIGELDLASQSILKALKYDPKDEKSRSIAQIIDHEAQLQQTGQNFYRLAKFLEDNKQEDKIQALLHAVPAELADNPYYLKVLYKHTPPKVWEDNEITIYCPPSVEYWSPKSLDEGGIGGSETAIVWLGRELTQQGWKVTVYNSCGNDAGEFDGVTYKNYWEMNWQDEFNVFVAWRCPEVYDLEINAKLKAVDVHDVMSPADFDEDRLKQIDKILVKTEYHKTLYPSVPDEKFEVISNGIDLNRFKGDVKRQKHKFVYSSTPNRGLDIVLKHWPTIKEALPEAELHVFYGWNTFYALEKGNPASVKWMKKVQAMMDQDGVVGHGRVGQDELAKVMMSSDAWLYPTYFEEINCITALENQAAGCIPLVTNYAALTETVTNDIKKIEGDIYNPEVQEEWVKLVIDTMKDDKREDLRTDLKEFADNYSWKNIATAWSDVFKNNLTDEGGKKE